MNEQSKTKTTWWERNKKKVIIIGGTVITFGIAFALYKYKDILLSAISASFKTTAEPTAKIISDGVSTNVAEAAIEETLLLVSSDPRVPHEVRRHIRNLHEGWHASPEKIAEARKFNIILEEGQTWVDNYTKGLRVA